MRALMWTQIGFLQWEKISAARQIPLYGGGCCDEPGTVAILALAVEARTTQLDLIHDNIFSHHLNDIYVVVDEI